MIEDAELLRRYAEERSEDAFAELVRRHLNLVYSAAFRQVGGDLDKVRDIAQSVFTDLARKAAALSRRRVLSGWLYTSACFAAAKVMRGERRRQAREQEALAMNDLLSPGEPAPDWSQLRPVLDDAMHELNEADREAVLLRYFESRQLAEVGSRLGLSENTARMRLERALDKLRLLLAKRGVTSTATALATLLVSQSVTAAPAGMAASVAGASLAGVATGGATALTLTKIMTMTKLKISLISAAIIAGIATTTFVVYRHAPPRRPARIASAPSSRAMPSPNGFDDFVQAARLVTGNTANVAQMGRNELAALVAQNAEALKTARQGLDRESRAPNDYSANYMTLYLPVLSSLKQLTSVLLAEGKLAEMDRRLDDAVHSYLDAIQLGQESARGGVIMFKLIGLTSEAQGLKSLAALAGSLDGKQCREVAHTLETLDAREPAYTEILDEENSYSTALRATLPTQSKAVTEQLDKMADPAIQKFIAKHQADQLMLRRTLIAFASHAYEVDKRASPPTLAALVPTYLKTVPRDPATNQELSGKQN